MDEQLELYVRIAARHRKVVPSSLVAEDNVVRPSTVGPEGSNSAFVPQTELHPQPFILEWRCQHEVERETVGLAIAGPRHVLRWQVEVALPAIQSDADEDGLVEAEVKHANSAPDRCGSREQFDALQFQLLLLKSHLHVLVQRWDIEEA